MGNIKKIREMRLSEFTNGRQVLTISDHFSVIIGMGGDITHVISTTGGSTIASFDSEGRLEELRIEGAEEDSST